MGLFFPERVVGIKIYFALFRATFSLI